MPKYYCDYCDTYLTHDSPSVRKTHCTGRKHKDNVKFFYQKWMEEQAQHLIDATTAAFKAGKIANNPFATAGKGVAIPPPAALTMAQRPPGPGAPGMLPPVPPMMMGPHGPMPPMMGMRPPMMGMMPMAQIAPGAMGPV
ncbi:U1 small nuclear ribonucleoprotein C-like isoform X4 [Photinus pyralis]|nr:U1 small nuclear ribonucleoprotein C-like isoform X4 [Photinus pyralis]